MVLGSILMMTQNFSTDFGQFFTVNFFKAFELQSLQALGIIKFNLGEVALHLAGN